MGFIYNLLDKGMRIMLFFSLLSTAVLSAPTLNTERTYFPVNSEFRIPDKPTKKSGLTFGQSQFLRFVGPCGNKSLLDCSEIQKSLPVNLSFDGSEGGLANTGFTMADPPSANRLNEDAPIGGFTYSGADQPIGFEPQFLSFDNGRLVVNARKGINFITSPPSTNTNTMINGLGVAFDANNAFFTIKTTVVNPYSDGNANSEQAGLWFGLNDNNYVKVVVVNSGNSGTRNYEMRRELGGISGTADVVNVNGISFPANASITLSLDVNPVNNELNGYYSINGATRVLIGTFTGTSHAGLINGATVDGQNVSFAGIMATKRNEAATTVVNYTFEDFSIEGEEIVLPDEIVAPYRINVGGNDYTKDGDLFLAENTIYLSESTPTTVSLTPITNPYLVPGGHEDLYFPRRFGSDFGYNFPIENGTYSVRIHMVENFQTTAGARVFDIIMEDNVAQDNLDLFAVYGKGALGITQNNVTVSDGELNIQFLASANNALIQAIEILPLTQSLEKEILSFEFAEQTGPAIIDFISKTVSIEVAEGTDPNGLIPSITISNLASISPLSNVAQDFSSPVQYTVTAEDGSTAIWTVSVSIATTDFSFIDDFDTYGTGNLNIIAPTQWLWENGAGVQIPVLDQGISPNTTHSLDFSLGGHTHDLIPLTANPVSLTPNKPFYFSTYFNVEALGAGAGDRLRTAIRIDDGDPGIQWVRLQMAKAGNDLIARIGLGDAASDNGNVGVDYGKTIQFVVKGEWDGSGNINYLWTIEPKLDESQNTWVSAGFHPVVGTPQIGRLFISSVNTNNGKVGPVRLSTDYSEVVTEDLTSPVPSSEKSILDFLIVGQIGSTVIDNEANTVQITVPFGTEITEISPLFSVSESATASPASGEVQDFSSPVVYTVTAQDGTIQQWTVSVTVEAGFEVKVNFQNNPSFTVPPVGYLPDYGKQFGFSSVTFEGEDYAFGWKLRSTGDPIDVSEASDNGGTTAFGGAGRNRIAGSYASASIKDQLEGTLLHFQGDNIMNTSGGVQSWAGQRRGNELIWELEVPNGIYDVTIGLGDKDINNIDSRHSATIEGITIIPAKVAVAGEVRVETMTVEVTDGFLTMNGVGGFNSKITHIEIVESTNALTAGALSFDPASLATGLSPETTGSFIGNLNGSGATDIGLVIDDVVNVINKNNTGFNDWLTLPGTAGLGEITFNTTSVGLPLGTTRNNTIIATAKGFSPALLEVDFTVTEALILQVSEGSLSFEGIEGSPISTQSITVSANSGSPSIVLTDDPSATAWLVIPSEPVLGELEFGILPGLLPGEYSTTITVSDVDGLYEPTEILVSLSIIESPPSTEKEITTISFGEAYGDPIIDAENSTISFIVPSGTDVTSLIPEFSVSEGASVLPESGTTLDFTNPVIFTVTAEDGSIQEWTVSVIVEEAPFVPFEAKINFQNNPSFTVPPVGYLPDYGKQFGFSSVTVDDVDYAFGWKLRSNGDPIDVSEASDNGGTTATGGAGRNRIAGSYASASIQDQLEGTLLHFQGDNIMNTTGGVQSWAGQRRGKELIWELEVPNGIYDVTIGLGDKDINNIDSRHSATIEGITIIPAKVAVAGEVRVETMTVEVTDGFLTMNGVGGFNSKITHIEIVESTNAPSAGVLSFDPASLLTGLVPETTGSFIGNLNGSGATGIGLVIDDVINVINKNNTGFNDWLTLPGTAGLGEITFSTTSVGLPLGTTRNNTIIATAKGFSPALLEVDFEVTEGPCSPFSTVPCDQIVKSLPVNLTFDGTEGGLLSGNGIETGFTMVDPYSGTRVAEDGTPTFASIPSYEPSKLTISDGNLVMNASKGIAFLTNNAQINTLGIGLQGINTKLTIETKLLGINTGPNAAQAGIWFGIDDKNFVKLNVNGTNVEVRREINDISSTAAAASNIDQIQITGVVIAGYDVTLRMEIDPIGQTITSYYAVGEGAFIPVTKTGFPTLALTQVYLDGLNSGDLLGTTFAGIYSTYRNNATSFNATFDYFSVSQDEVAANSPPIILPQEFTVNEGVAIGTIVGIAEASDADNEDLLYSITAGNNEGIFLINESTGEITTAVEIEFNSSPQYILTVAVSDGIDIAEANITININEVITSGPCSPYSLLDCDQIVGLLPINLTFDGSQGGLLDGNGLSTGFTMADPHSAPRLTEDLPITNPNVLGYEPSKLNINNGNLTITATKGIAFLAPPASINNNTQVNSLGVGIQNINTPLTIETKLLGINTGTGSGQAGIWFGLDEDNFVKLAVIANTIEIRKELGGVSSTEANTQDQILSPVNNSITGSDVTLRLVIDPQAQTIKGFYAIGNGAFVQLTKTGLDALELPQSYINGKSINGEITGVSFAGIYATYRNASTSFDATFDYFQVEKEDEPLSFNFTPNTLNFSGVEGSVIPSQTVTLSATEGNPTVTLNDDPHSAEWLILPDNPTLGSLEFGIVEGLTPGTYGTTIIASTDPGLGYQNAELVVNLVVTSENSPSFGLNVNFSDPATTPPTGYVRDGGDAFGNRGNGNFYGWLDANTSNPANLTLNGRNRAVVGVDVLNNTLIHMQYGDVSTNAALGYLPDAKWEIEVPNGNYQVTVFVGDPNIDGSVEDTPSHTVVVEGVNAINGFVPSGAVGAASRFTSGTVNVVVNDGRLTLDPGNGFNTKINSVSFISLDGEGGLTPRVLGVNPPNGAVGVPVNASISANNLFTPNLDSNGNAGVDNNTITPATVRLFKVGNPTQIAASLNGTAGGDAINLVPTLPLEANTLYRFEIEGVLDLTGVPFESFTSTFTTGGGVSGPTTDLDNVSFTRFGAVVSGTKKYTTLTIGPDEKLYGLTIDGEIHRWIIEADGTLSNQQVLLGLKSVYGERSAVGLEFDPSSTSENLIAYVSHNNSGLNNAPDWDGKLSRLTGPNLATEVLLITDLPRSTKDHLTNSIAFRPGEPNILYFLQGSNSAAGAPDGAWGNREESLLTAATLRLDLTKLPATLPLNVRTTRNQAAINAVDVNSPTLDGLYNPYYINAPLTLFASGVRNAYDLVWHSNGQLYIPTNGTAGGSNSPASVNGTRRPDGTFYDHSNPLYPVIPGTTNNVVQRDWLFRVNPNEPLGYYGHPNPFRGEYVLNRGTVDTNKYPAGIVPDPNYRGAAYDFGFNFSPNGVIEYRSNAENGNLTGAILVARYSGGSDIIALVPDGPNGDISTFKTGIPGFTGFTDPLDLIEDVKTGNIYVSDFSTNQIILLKPSNQAAPTPLIVLNTDKVVVDAVTTNGTPNSTFTQEILLSNLGNGVLNGITAQVTGIHSGDFTITNLVSSVNPQNSAAFNVVFNPSANGIRNAVLTVSGSNAESVVVPLTGLGKQGIGGANEPSLQWVLDAHLGQGVVNSGDINPATNVLDLPSGKSYNDLLGDEVDVQEFERAIDAPVTIEVLSVYGPTSSNPIVAFGWYNSGDASSTQEIFTVQNNLQGKGESNGQTLTPIVTGSTVFDPGTGNFGFYSRWPFFGNRQLFSEHDLNTFDQNIPRHVRVYELPGEENAYIIATEEHISGFDYQDIVVIARNVRPAVKQAIVEISPEELIFEVNINSDPAGKNTDTKTVTLTNNGNDVLNITGASIINGFANQFNLVSPLGSSELNPGESIEYTVTYAPTLDNSNLGYQDATLRIATDNPDQQFIDIGLYALKKLGLEGGNEPSLQAVVDVLGIGIDVGWTQLAIGTGTELKGEEVLVQRWIKAGSGPVNIKPVGRYSPSESLPFGWYTNNNGNVITNEVGILETGRDNAQTLFPPIASGTDVFDPQGSVFGIYVFSEFFNRVNYTEDGLNTGGVVRRVRTYPMKDRQGNLIENSYLVNFEDASNGDYQDYMFVIDNVVPFVDGTLRLEFEPSVINLTESINGDNTITRQVVLNANGPITPGEVTLSSANSRLGFPSDFEFGSPFEITFDRTGLGVGNYIATLTATSANYVSGELSFNLEISSDPEFIYQFNFQDATNVALSPVGYIDDLGTSFGQKSTALGDLNFGWVLPGTNTPASAEANGRNRNTGVNDDPLLKTFTIMGHRTPASFPLRDWLVNLPNGSYSVNISVGDVDFTDSNHQLDVNGVRVLSFDQQSSNPENLINFQDTKIVEVTNGVLRLSLGAGGVNAKPNYIRIAPINISSIPPVINAIFDGNMASENVFRGNVSVSFEALDQSQSGSIVRLEYSLENGPLTTFTEPLIFNQPGNYNIIVEAEDANGNTTTRSFEFSIEEPSGAVLQMDNMAKIPGTNIGFPAEDYYTFSRIHNITSNPNAKFSDQNTMRLSNSGTNDLVIDNISISDPARFNYVILPEGSPQTFPLVIQPGTFKELLITFTANNQNNRTLMKEEITIVSNADNGLNIKATLHGANAAALEGNNENDAQEVFDAFSFTTSMRSIVNDDGTITPPNPNPLRPSSNFPLFENIDAGYEGDMIFSPTFVQADPTKPVIGVQLSALHGPGSNGAQFVQVNGTGVVGGMSFSHNADWYQSLLPKNNSGVLTTDLANLINVPFRIAVAGYPSSGGNNLSGNRPDLLGLRIYKAIDRNGNIIPNEYIVLQDFIGSGCGAGSANCDWNDNTFYFKNIRPEAVPTASAIAPIFVDATKPFEAELGGNFDKAYPGNILTFSATLLDGSALPNWMNISTIGKLSGTVPGDGNNEHMVIVTATDLNGLTASETIQIQVNQLPVAVASSNTLQGRIPFSVEFRGEDSSDDGEIISYNWNFGDGGTSSEANPTYQFLNTGEFEVTLTVTDDRGLENTTSLNIRVIDFGPLAVASSDITQGLAPLSISFDGSLSDSDVEIVEYKWNFGNGVEALGPIVNYIYEVGGNFTVTLMVTDANGLSDQVSLQISVAVNQPPVAVASSNVTSGAFPLTVNFNAGGSTDDFGIVSYLWDFGNGETSNLISPVVVYEELGVYDVTLTVTDEQGLSDADGLTITVVEPQPEPNFVLRINAGGPELTYNGEVFAADANFIGGKSYTNTNAAVPALYQTERSANPPTFGYNIPVPNGSYTINLHFAEIYWGATGGGPGGNAGQRIFDVSINGQLVLDNYDINAEVGPQNIVIKTFEVEVVNGQILMDFSALASVGGVNEPKLSAFEIFGITNVPNEAPVAVATADPLSGFAPLTVAFSSEGSSDDGEIVSYSWDFGDGNTSLEENPTHIYTIPGNYSAVLTVTDGEGLIGTSSVDIIVSEEPGAFSLYLNTGSAANVSLDGKTFIGDLSFPSYYNSTHTYTNVNASTIPLYQTERGSQADLTVLNFTIPVPNGIYNISTFHNELYFGKVAGAPSGIAGRRVFDILIEGQVVKDDFDIFLESTNQPVVLNFNNVEVLDGILNLSMIPSANRASISGLSIEKVVSNVELPDVPVLLSPSNGSTGLERIVNLTWQTVPNADDYSVQVSSDVDFGNIIIDESGIVENSFTTSELTANTTYFWRVLASNVEGDSDWSETRSFTTEQEVVVNPDEDLIGHWKMDEGSGNVLVDHSGNGNNALLQSTAGVSWSQGVIGLALELPGNWNRFGIAPHSPSLQINDAVTISAWVKPNVVGRNTVIRKSDGKGFELTLSNDGLVYFHLNRDANGSAYLLRSAYNYTADVGQWIHVAATFDGTTSKIFINGIENASATYAPFDIGTASGDLTIAAYGNVQRFNGAMDDLRLYGRALDETEVFTLFGGEAPLPSVPQLLAPENGNSSVTAPDAQLFWLQSDFANGYRVQIANSADFSSPLADADAGDALFFGATGLLPETTYFWRVLAYNGEGNSEWSETRSFTTVTNGEVPDGPVGHWKMDEGSGNVLVDHSGNGNNALLQSTAGVSWSQGVIGLAVELPGTWNRFGIAPHSPSLQINDAVTISAWVKPNVVGRNTVIRKSDGKGFELTLSNDGLVYFHLNRDANGSAYLLRSAYNYTADVGQWIHVAATFDGTTSKIFINGIENASASYAPFGIGTASGDLTIAAYGNVQRFNGAMDDLRLYGRALDEIEVFTLFGGEAPLPSVPQLLAPENGNSSVTAPDAQLFWLQSDFANGYRVQIANSADFSSPLADTDVGDALFFGATGLLPETTYYWRVLAYNGEGNSEWSETRSFTTVTNGEVPDGPVGHWKMDEGSGNVLVDHSGNGNNALLQSTAGVTWSQGVIGLAVELPGTWNRFGITPHSPSLQINDAVTISAWVKPNVVGRNTVIRKSDGKGFELTLNSDGLVYFHLNRDANGSAYLLRSTYNYTVDVGQWIHVAATFDGTTSKIFINGIENASATYAPFDIGTASGDLTIAAYGNIQRFNGAMDDLRLYGRALNISEITDLYTNSSNIARKSEGSVKGQIIEETQFSVQDPETDALFGFKIYPNPVEDRLHIQLNSREETTVGVIVYDMMGRQYINRSAVPENGEIVLDLAPVRMAAGTYLLILDQGQGRMKQVKFIKK